MRFIARFTAAVIAMLPALFCFTARAAEQVQQEEQVLALAAQARERGCPGHAGTRAALQWSPLLARAAARIARGEAAMAALDKEGFRARRMFHANFAGYGTPGEVASALAQHYCAALVEPRYSQLGAHREGRHWTLVLAEPFQLPQLADKRLAAQRVLALVNEARTHARRCGERAFAPAPPLEWNAQLEQAAAMHAADMAAHRYLDHKGRDGSTPSQRIGRTGYAWRNVGENLAAGQATPEDVVEDWLSSPGHCANVMEPAFTQIGVAFSVNMNSDAAVYWAQEFGRPR